MTNETEMERREALSKSGANSPGSEQALASSGERIKDEAGRATAELRQQGEELASTVKEQADRFATSQKDAGAQHFASFARAVERGADELESTSPELAHYAHKAASSVSKLSDTLRQSNVRDLIDDTNDFAKREPALFFGAAVVAGMALSRFLRSSAEHEESTRRPGENAPASGNPATGSST